jgi:hypothetical protein
MLAVQEQKLTHQEKSVNLLAEIMERRREEYDKKIQNVYDVMRDEDKKVLLELELIRKEQKEQHKSITDRMSALEKIIWTYLGGFSVIMFVISYGPTLLKMFK